MPEEKSNWDKFLEIMDIGGSEAVDAQPHVVFVKTPWNTMLGIIIKTAEWQIINDIANISERAIEDVLIEIISDRLNHNKDETGF